MHRLAYLLRSRTKDRPNRIPQPDRPSFRPGRRLPLAGPPRRTRPRQRRTLGQGLLAESEGDEEIRWASRAGTEAVAQEIDRLAAEQTDRRIAIWLQVRHGGRRMTQLAKQYGYSDGSGIHRVLQRLEARAKQDRQLDRQLKSLAKSVAELSAAQ